MSLLAYSTMLGARAENDISFLQAEGQALALVIWLLLAGVAALLGLL